MRCRDSEPTVRRSRFSQADSNKAGPGGLNDHRAAIRGGRLPADKTRLFQASDAPGHGRCVGVERLNEIDLSLRTVVPQRHPDHFLARVQTCLS